MAQIEGHFDNGYGVSIIDDGYGYQGGLYELAVLDSSTGELVYDTPITGDVLPSLTENEVRQAVERVKALPPRIETHNTTKGIVQ